MTRSKNKKANGAESIFQSLERDITGGVYRPDEPLPSIRELASELQVSPATVAAAFRKLAARGLTYVERGVGTKVRNEALLSDSLTHGTRLALPGVLNVASGAPDAALLPDLNLNLRRIDVTKVLYDVEPMLPGLRDLGQKLMADVMQRRAASLTIASGALDAISDAVEVRLRPGDRVIVEDPGFAAASSLLRSHALTLVPVPVDDEGFKVDPFAAAVKLGVKAVLYSPRAQNPYGSAMTAKRAAELREALRHVDENRDPIFIIENDHASLVSDVDYHSLTDSSTAWLSVRSLSKSHGPDLRFSFVAGDALTVERLKRRQALNRGWISTILQRLVIDLLSDPEVQRGTQQASTEYSRRRTRLINALAKRDVLAFGRSGLNVLVPVEDEGSVSNALLTHGWQTRNGQTYRHESRPFIRVTTAALSDNQIDMLADHIAEKLHSAASVFR